MTQRGKHFFLLAFLLFSISTVAQVDVKGRIIEEQSKEAIEQATVRLLNMKDSSMVNGTVSSRNGAFMLRTRLSTAQSNESNESGRRWYDYDARRKRNARRGRRYGQGH